MGEIHDEMTLELNFHFHCEDVDAQVDNNSISHFRKRVARILADCGFGDVTERDDGTFHNAHLNTFVDAYMPRLGQLRIWYHAHFPLEFNGGSLEQLINSIPQLRQYAHDFHCEAQFYITIRGTNEFDFDGIPIL